VIEIINVHKSYHRLEVLKDVSMNVEKGEVVVVIGASGSGKSMLLQCINGLESIDSGRIVVDGIDVHARTTDLNKLRCRIGIVFQSFNVFPQYTVSEKVALAPRIVLGMSRQQAARARQQADFQGRPI
jgi:ABC-type polar amino acid transport system ATPase subunit